MSFSAGHYRTLGILEELCKRWEARADHIELDHRGGVADNIRRCIFELCDEVGLEAPSEAQALVAVGAVRSTWHEYKPVPKEREAAMARVTVTTQEALDEIVTAIGHLTTVCNGILRRVRALESKTQVGCRCRYCVEAMQKEAECSGR